MRRGSEERGREGRGGGQLSLKYFGL